MLITRELQNEFFVNWRVNTLFLIMVPKKEGEKGIGDFQPIILLNRIYKIIAKALATHLSMVIESIISEFQSYSVHGRQIQDSIVIANKLIDSRIKEKLPWILHKLDFFKALDCVSWDYLDYILAMMGFRLRWRS